jgi:hypothetical protein
MIHRCPLCRAKLSQIQCRERFNYFLALEFEQPLTFGRLHFLTVACYMLQHNEYSRKAWLETQQMVVKYIEKGISPANLLKEYQKRLDNRKRDWSINKGSKLSEFEKISWSNTIADIRFDTPENYCLDITNWAKSVVKDTSLMVSQLTD